jgi:hypothetical protein
MMGLLPSILLADGVTGSNVGPPSPSTDLPSSAQLASESSNIQQTGNQWIALLSDIGSHLTPSGPLVWKGAPPTLLYKASRLAGLFATTDKPIELPAEFISLQFSRSFLEEYFGRAVERDTDVDDMILGTRIAGRSHLTGTVKLLWQPEDNPDGFDLIFRGVCRSQTDGLHEVVTLHNQAETRFEACKQIEWTEDGLKALPAVAKADTHSTTVNIDSSLPGFLGRIATGIAEQRVAESRAQADAISSEHAAKRIQDGFDARINRSLVWLRLASRHFPTAGFLRTATRLKLSNTPELLQLAVYRREASDAALSEMPEGCDVAIRLHRGVLNRFLEDRTALLVCGAIAMQMLMTESEATSSRSDSSSQVSTLPSWQLARSADGQWLLVQHIAPPPANGDSIPAAPKSTLAAPVSVRAPAVR